jgi:hypothetical protein
MQTLAVTGHRPHHLAGGYSDVTRERLIRLATWAIGDMRPDNVRIGMAQGFDQACAVACLRLGVSWTAVLPGLASGTQQAHWPRPARERYDQLLALATDVEQCPFDGAGREFVHRDMALVAPADWLLALWNGDRSGTGLTVRLAMERDVPVWNVWDAWHGA